MPCPSTWLFAYRLVLAVLQTSVFSTWTLLKLYGNDSDVLLKQLYPSVYLPRPQHTYILAHNLLSRSIHTLYLSDSDLSASAFTNGLSYRSFDYIKVQ